MYDRSSELHSAFGAESGSSELKEWLERRSFSVGSLERQMSVPVQTRILEKRSWQSFF